MILITSLKFHVDSLQKAESKIKLTKKLFDFDPKCHSIHIEWSGKISSSYYGVLDFSDYHGVVLKKGKLHYNNILFDIIYRLTVQISIYEK